MAAALKESGAHEIALFSRRLSLLLPRPLAGEDKT